MRPRRHHKITVDVLNLPEQWQTMASATTADATQRKRVEFRRVR